MPRFVILEHDYPELHWDLMLEAGEVLHTWRLAQAPENSAEAIPATALGDHRRLYLDYEGPVSGGRGTVRRWDAGEFVAAAETAPDRHAFKLHGARIYGEFWLEHVGGDMWTFLAAVRSDESGR